MIIDTVKVGNTSRPYKFYVSNFESIQDFVRHVETAKTNKVFENEDLSSKRLGYSDFNDFSSFDEALVYFEYGTDKYYKEFTDKYKVVKNYIETNLSKKISGYKKDVVGFLPVVPDVLIGNPLNMITSDRKPKRIPTARIFIDRGASCSNTTNKIIQFACIVFSLIQILENRGIRCEVNVVATAVEEREGLTSLLKIKDFTQPLNLFKIQFPIIAPDYFRRINFRIIETDPNIKEDWTYGYGHPLKYCRWDGFSVKNGKVGEGYKQLFNLADSDIYVAGIDNFEIKGKLDNDIREIIQNTNFSSYFNIEE